MGAPIAERLAGAAHDVIVWNRTRAKAEAVKGATIANTPGDAVHGADVMLTMLADGNAVEEAVRNIDAVPLWIQMSTIGIDATDGLKELASERGGTFVDAPVLGSKEPAARGELVILASGPVETHPMCDPIFDVLGKKTLWLGATGAGTRLKIVVNAWLVSLVTALAETIALARGLELDPHLFFDAIADGPLDFGYARAKGQAMLAEDFSPNFSLKLAQKDVRLALDAADRARVDLRVAEAVAELFERAIGLGHGDDDFAAVYFAVRT
jgi:3-hydroxyisobutyrate dehydrogenase